MTTKQLSIQTGVVSRLIKEVASYKAEADMLLKRVTKMEENNEDEYEVRQQRRVHADSVQMIPNSEKRLHKAVGELESLVESADDDLRETDEFKAASQTLERARAASVPPEGA